MPALGARRFSGTHVSPDGSLLAITADDGTVFGWPLAGGGAARVLAKLGPNEAFVGWSNEPARILVATWTGPRARIEAMDLGSGRRTAVREIAVADPVGMLATPELFLSGDAQTYMYGTARMLSTLYLVSGLDQRVEVRRLGPSIPSSSVCSSGTVEAHGQRRCASYLPARKAARVDPVEALKAQ